MPDKIDIPGYYGHYAREVNYGKFEKIYYPVTGHFVMLKDEPKSMKLYDDHVRAFHGIDRVSFLWGVNSPKEGKKKFPRPFVYEESGDDLKLVSQGEKVKITYVEGSWEKPLVEGAIESMAVINQKKFLRLDGGNLDRQSERYESEKYIYEFENDGKGNLNFLIEAKEEGEGNIDITLLGSEKFGKINLYTNHGYTINHIDEENVLQQIVMDKDGTIIAQNEDGEEVQHINLIKSGGVKIRSKRTKNSEMMVYGDTLQGKLEEIIDEINKITVPTPVGPSGIPNNMGAFMAIRSKLNEILTD